MWTGDSSSAVTICSVALNSSWTVSAWLLPDTAGRTASRTATNSSAPSTRRKTVWGVRFSAGIGFLQDFFYVESVRGSVPGHIPTALQLMVWTAPTGGDGDPECGPWTHIARQSRTSSTQMTCGAAGLGHRRSVQRVDPTDGKIGRGRGVEIGRAHV